MDRLTGENYSREGKGHGGLWGVGDCVCVCENKRLKDGDVLFFGQEKDLLVWLRTNRESVSTVPRFVDSSLIPVPVSCL